MCKFGSNQYTHSLLKAFQYLKGFELSMEEQG